MPVAIEGRDDPIRSVRRLDGLGIGQPDRTAALKGRDCRSESINVIDEEQPGKRRSLSVTVKVTTKRSLPDWRR